MTKTYSLTSKFWLYDGLTAWHFITIPQETTKDIDLMFAHAKRGWGSLPVIVTIGKTAWKTSIFPDKKTSTYLLPVKVAARKKEEIEVGDEVTFVLDIAD